MHFQKLFNYCPVCGSSSFHYNNPKSKKCANCQFTYYVNPSAAVAALIINEQNQLLVCVRANEPGKGTYDLPGGFIDEHETAEEALLRELKEELHIHTVQSLTYAFSLPNEYLYSGWTLPTLDIFFKVTIDEHTDISSGDDVAAFKFISISHLQPEEFGLKSIKKAISLLKHNRFSE